MIVIRFLVALIANLLFAPVIILAAIGGGIMTLYFGLVERDWKQENWQDLGHDMKLYFIEVKNFILNK